MSFIFNYLKKIYIQFILDFKKYENEFHIFNSCLSVDVQILDDNLQLELFSVISIFL